MKVLKKPVITKIEKPNIKRAILWGKN